MTEPKLRPARRKTQRRWRIPPVLTQGSEVFEGLGVLHEVPGEGGVVLWQLLRDASLWAESAPEIRPGLFHRRDPEPSALDALPSELVSSARDLQALSDPERVAAACRTIARWAEENALLATALAFSQTSAFAEPMDPETAYDVARLARRRGEEARAETWYRRTVAVARQRGDWATYSRAFIGLGALHARRGNLGAARRFCMRAFRAANRNTLRELEGRALHRLFSAAAETGQRREAVRLAREALASFGAGHPRTSRLALDVARHWVADGRFDRALPVLRALLPRLDGTSLRLPALAELARASGGTGDADAFLDAWTQAWEVAREEPDAAPVRALLSLARGAAALGAWSKAETAARHALRLATERADPRGCRASESLLETIARRAAPPRAAETPEPAGAEALAAELMRALREAEPAR
ncbi:MAG: hypothetical protein ICV87_01980 [Gemmatimonadetes bacterium]|nr:hypothetical protein [Gemmatimonadota bacterium]